MGIPHLMRHLLPYSEHVVVERKQSQAAPDYIPKIDSVVIDGPNLVYHVFGRLLSWADPRLGILDAQPSCNEVSTGVVFYLLQLMLLGIKIEKICFDGALPETKQETRLGRLERSRKKLEQFCSQYRSTGFADCFENGSSIDPRRVLRSRPMPVKFNCLPEDSFMVSAVFEDLRKRWDKENIYSAARDFIYPSLLESEMDFPWSNTTIMVPGEADIECASIAKLIGSTVLTNDSDLLLYDLGPRGSVLFLGSVEMDDRNASGPIEYKIKGRRICPALLESQLGIRNIRHFAYELSRNPQLGLPELMRRSKEYWEFEQNPDYHRFASEYDSSLDGNDSQQRKLHLPQNLDPRISELFIQYDLESIRASDDAAQIYLVILNEDHARRCAWEEGRLYRTLGYSVLNMFYPAPQKLSFVDEFLRRGPRITKQRIALQDKNWIATEMMLLCERLKAARAAFGGDISLPSFWRLFALCHLHGFDMEDVSSSDTRRLFRFLQFGRMGLKLEWGDIHLCAQINAVLYSIRILKQLLETVAVSDEYLVEARSIIAVLPPLYIMMKPRRELARESSNIPAEETEKKFREVFRQFNGTHIQGTEEAQAQNSMRNSANPQKNKPKKESQARYGASNPYEFLSME